MKKFDPKWISVLLTVFGMIAASLIYVNGLSKDIDEKLDRYVTKYSFNIICNQLDRIEKKVDNLSNNKK